MTTAIAHEQDGALDRFEAPLYTIAETARYLDVPASTLATWAHGRGGERRSRSGDAVTPLVSTVAAPRGAPVVPFVGLAEALVLGAMRRGGVPLQRIRPALANLDREIGIRHALASQRLYTDGAEVLYDFAEKSPDPRTVDAGRQLVVVRNGQRVFSDVVASYLKHVKYGDDGYVRLVQLPAYGVAEVIVDPARGFGQPIFARGGARLEDALALFRAGEPLDVVADEFGVPPDHLEDAVRIAIPA